MSLVLVTWNAEANNANNFESPELDILLHARVLFVCWQADKVEQDRAAVLPERL